MATSRYRVSATVRNWWEVLSKGPDEARQALAAPVQKAYAAKAKERRWEEPVSPSIRGLIDVVVAHDRVDVLEWLDATLKLNWACLPCPAWTVDPSFRMKGRNEDWPIQWNPQAYQKGAGAGNLITLAAQHASIQAMTWLLNRGVCADGSLPQRAREEPGHRDHALTLRPWNEKHLSHDVLVDHKASPEDDLRRRLFWQAWATVEPAAQALCQNVKQALQETLDHRPENLWYGDVMNTLNGLIKISDASLMRLAVKAMAPLYQEKERKRWLDVPKIGVHDAGWRLVTPALVAAERSLDAWHVWLTSFHDWPREDRAALMGMMLSMWLRVWADHQANGIKTQRWRSSAVFLLKGLIDEGLDLNDPASRPLYPQLDNFNVWQVWAENGWSVSGMVDRDPKGASGVQRWVWDALNRNFDAEYWYHSDDRSMRWPHVVKAWFGEQGWASSLVDDDWWRSRLQDAFNEGLGADNGPKDFHRAEERFKGWMEAAPDRLFTAAWMTEAMAWLHKFQERAITENASLSAIYPSNPKTADSLSPTINGWVVALLNRWPASLPISMIVLPEHGPLVQAIEKAEFRASLPPALLANLEGRVLRQETEIRGLSASASPRPRV